MGNTNIVIATDIWVRGLNEILRSYPPVIGVSKYDNYGNHLGVQDYPMPYNITDISSRCIKVAAAPNSYDSQQFITELKAALAPFDSEVNTHLLRNIEAFVRYLVVMFTRFGWYDQNNEAPHRFVGFCDNTLDIELRSN